MKKYLFSTSLTLSLLCLMFITMSSHVVQAQEETLQIGLGVNFVTWDPHSDQRSLSLLYLNPIYDGLIRETNDGSSFEPELATEWELDDTGVTFTLREGVTFHDGTAFNAEAVVANFDRVKADGNPVNRGLLRNIESAEAIDDLTVRFNFSQFDGTVLLSLARFSGKMISPAAFEDAATNPVGAGAYVYNADESSADNTLIVLDANPDYWNPDGQPASRIEIIRYGDPATALNGLQAGEFHTVGLAPIPLLAQAEGLGYDVSMMPSIGWSAHILDRTGSIVPELADERVRRAMSFALDREVYWEVINVGELSTQFAPVGGYAFNEEIEDLSFNMEMAMQLMEEAGNPTFTIDVPSAGALNPRNAFLASSWEPLGITVNVVQTQNIFASCQQNDGDFAVAICPINELHIKHFVENRLLPEGNLNPFGHVDEEIVALYEEAATLPLDEAESLYAEIARISAEQAYIIHIGWGSTPIVSDPARISGVEARALMPGSYYLGDVELLDG